MRHRFVLAFAALALVGCAALAGLVKVAGPIVCEELVSAIDPGSGAEVGKLCPAVASALASILAEKPPAWHVQKSGLPPSCEPMPLSQVDASAHPSAYLCAGRLGGESEARKLYELAQNVAATRAQDAGR